MSALTLYQISENLAALLDTLDMCEGDEEMHAECEAEIERAVEVQLRKVDDFCRFLAHLDSRMLLAAEEIERLKARKRRFEKHAERLERYAVRVMQTLELNRLEGETSTLFLRQNPRHVEIVDESVVPRAFKVASFSIDKRAVKRAIESGIDVPGADLRFGTVSLVRR